MSLTVTYGPRKATVKTTPNTTLQEVLSQACQDQQLTESNYDLIYKGKSLDLSLTVRFANLPNNSQLELKQRTAPREGGLVSIAVQTDSGQRITGKFSSADSLHHVISSTSGIPSLKGKEVVVVYTRREIVGEDALHNTTLASLGLTSGSAVLRVTTRDRGMEHVQAHVEDLRLKKGNSKDSGPSKAEEVVSEVKESVSKFGKSLKKMVSGVFDSEKKGSVDQGGHRLGSASDQPQQPGPSTSKSSTSGQQSSKSQPQLQPKTAPLSATSTSSPQYPVNKEVVWLGERDALLFQLNDMSRMRQSTSSGQDDLPDDFFEVTHDDVILMYQDLKGRIADIENRPLETAALRERRKKETRYSKCVIRICFPTDGLFLQGTFSPQETVSAVHAFVRSFLRDPNIPFYLYTTPPKEILKQSDTLVEKKLVPAAVIHFGVKEGTTGGPPFIAPSFLNKITSFEAMSAETAKLREEVRRTMVTTERVQAVPPVPVENNNFLPGNQELPTTNRPTTDPQKVPKWFKPAGK